MLSVNNLSVHFTGTYIFNDVTFLVNDRDRIGLVGRNGAGKSTLLKIIAGLIEPEKGRVTSPNGQRIGYLPQETDSKSAEAVFIETLKAFEEANQLETDIDQITQQISQRTDYESEAYERLITRLNEANERYNMIGGHAREAEAEKVLIGLGFEKSDFVRSLTEFSGGWRMRVEIAKLLLQKPDILLLDEPTNHLDIESIQWLEDFLKVYPGAVVLVSHDRTFLDHITTRTIEISLGKIYDYKANYSRYLELRQEQREHQLAAYNNQQQQIAQIEKFVERFRYKATKSNQVQSRIKQLEKMDRVDVEQFDNASIHFTFPPAPSSGRVVVEADQLSKAYGDHLVLNKLEFAIEKNDFVAFVGRNGEGKSTLVKIIIGELEHSGTAKLGHNVKIGYYAQNQAQMLDENKTVFETIDDVATGDMRTKVKNLLGSFLFSGEDMDKKVKVLSGGEKSRLALARMLLTPVNLLVLDEPTNHLDMQSKDILKNALLHYSGTLILVSHDRDFLQGLTNKVYEFRNKGIKPHLGDVSTFMEARRLESLKALETMQKGGEKAEKVASQNKLDYQMRKQQDRDRRKVQNRIGKCEEKIEQLEAEIAAMDEKLANPDSFGDAEDMGAVYSGYDQLKKALENQMQEWEDLQLELEAI